MRKNDNFARDKSFSHPYGKGLGSIELERAGQDEAERIAYISSDGNYVTVVLHDRTEHVFAFNLLRMQKLVETQLAEEAACFIRIGKSLIINRNYIYKINLTKQELVLSDSRLDGAFRLSASREALRQLKELLEKEAGL